MPREHSLHGTRACTAALLLACVMSLPVSAAPKAQTQVTPTERTHAQQEYMIGMRAYRRGDWPVALQHLRQAAKLGSTNAMVALGDGYAYEEFGNDHTRPLAIILYRAAAHRANPAGMERLGFAYLSGAYGAHQDYARARVWLRRAAAGGNSDAMVLIGNMYCTGNGVDENRHTARIWYARAARAGNSDAQAYWRDHAQSALRTNSPPVPGMFPGPCMTRQPDVLGTMGGHIRHVPLPR
ncbi:MAG: sel1 repeat family protein [Alphaproteobacteria bacterium]|nr:sel1 repeat family protein [Alphaproteobacteria bacterium]